jgi:hypothetical protein
MAYRNTRPLAGWGPPAGPTPIRPAGPLGRYLWPAVAVGSFAALAAYVAASDGQPGLADRSLLAVALAAVVIVVLTVRRAAGAGALARTLAEYAAVALLAVSLVTLGQSAPPPAAAPQVDRPGAVVRTDAPAGLRERLVSLWRQAEAEARRRTGGSP